MAYRIPDECHGCGTCADHCPVEAIHESDDVIYIVDSEACVDCGTCKEVCWYDLPIEED